jgi:hypothetical protein
LRQADEESHLRSDTRRAKLAATVCLPIAVSQVELLFTNIVDQISDTLEPIGFIMRNFDAGKVLESNKELDTVKPISAEVVAQVCSICDTAYIDF